MDYKHIMLDLETLSTKGDAAILSIGAVVFDLKNKLIGDSFYNTINLQDCIDLKLRIDASTFYWWINQSEIARQKICDHPINMNLALLNFTSFCKKHLDENFEIWSKGQSFDISILKNAYQSSKLPCPWNYLNERDVRTYVRELDQEFHVYNYENSHDPVSDCIDQIKTMFNV